MLCRTLSVVIFICPCLLSDWWGCVCFDSLLYSLMCLHGWDTNWALNFSGSITKSVPQMITLILRPCLMTTETIWQVLERFSNFNVFDEMFSLWCFDCKNCSMHMELTLLKVEISMKTTIMDNNNHDWWGFLDWILALQEDGISSILLFDKPKQWPILWG